MGAETAGLLCQPREPAPGQLGAHVLVFVRTASLFSLAVFRHIGVPNVIFYYACLFWPRKSLSFLYIGKLHNVSLEKKVGDWWQTCDASCGASPGSDFELSEPGLSNPNLQPQMASSGL